MIPEELIYAAGAIPVRLCGGSHGAAVIGDELAPRDACALVKSSLGQGALQSLDLYTLCDVIIVPTTCDGKRKMAEELARNHEVWMLEVPHLKEPASARLNWLEQLHALKAKLEELTHQKIKRKGLQQGITLLAKAQQQAHRLYQLRQNNPPLIRGSEAGLALQAFGYSHVADWTQAMTTLNDEIEARSTSVEPSDAPRILCAGSPMVFPNWKIPTLIEEMGGALVVDESCFGDRFLYDPVAVSDTTVAGMMAALAARTLMPCVCPSFSPNDDRLHRLRQIVADFDIKGVLYHVLKGCVLYDFELKRVKELLQELGIPLLRIETDYSPEDIEQLRIRVEAFIEMLKE